MARLIYLILTVFACTSIQAADETKIEDKSASDEKGTKAGDKTEGSKSTKHESEEEFILKPTTRWKEKEPSYYRIPKAATKGVKGIAVPYTLWYDHYTWEESEPLNEHAEKSFRIDDQNIYAIIVTDKEQIALDELDDIVIKNAKESRFEHAKIVSIEKRKVNGNDIVFMHWNAILQGIHVDFLSYLYSDAKGSVFLHTYTPSALIKLNKKDMETFLNGFTIETKENSDADKDPDNNDKK